MNSAGYYRFPTIHSDTIIFVSEDDLWSVAADGGIARRLTSNLGRITHPLLSPDGQRLAFVGREEGSEEVYVMPAIGGAAKRLTYLSSRCQVAGWSADGANIIFASNHGQVVSQEMALFQVAADGSNGQVEALPYGPARGIAFGPGGETILGRNTAEPARWKRYRGGTAGHLWIDRSGDGEFTRFLPDLAGNITSPMWIETEDGSRTFFVSDHEGIGNLYSCRPDGSDLQRLTDHSTFYVRNPTSDGQRIVYHAGADLYIYDIASAASTRVEVAYHSPRVQRNRKFVNAARYLSSASLHPSGKAMAITTRGKPFAFFNFDGPVIQFGQRGGVRYRLVEWLNDGRRLVMVSDEPGEEFIEIHDAEPDEPSTRFEGLDIGRPVALKVSPAADKVAITNHRHELLILDIANGELIVADRSLYRRIAGFDWSPDGRWLAYDCAVSPQTTAIRLYRLPEAETEVETDEGGEQSEDVDDGVDDGEGEDIVETPQTEGEVFTITEPVLHDICPAFDPEGKFLYLLSHREFNPVYDGLHFDLGFPWGARPYLITLRNDLVNPFLPRPDLDSPEPGDSPDQDDDGKNAEEFRMARRLSATGNARKEIPMRTVESDGETTAESDHEVGTAEVDGEEADTAEPGSEDAEEAARLRIDLDGIERRIYAFPVPDGKYGAIGGIKGKAIFSEFPIRGQLDDDEGWDDEDDAEYGTLRMYDFKEYRSETLIDGITWFELSRNTEKLLYATGRSLRVIAAGEKPPRGGGHPRKTGWIDLDRVKVSVSPQREWEQMFREAWRLQRDHFWTEDMSEVDWQAIYQQYFPLISRVSTRSEFSDLMWEMQGELGTSHAYEFGGDYRRQPVYGQGFLGASLTWDPEAKGYRINDFVMGDPWDTGVTSPLADPGLAIKPGDILLAINGQRLDGETGPSQLLVNQANQEVLLTLAATEEEDASDSEPDEETDAETDGDDEAVEDAEMGADADSEPDEEPSGHRTRHLTVRTIRSESPARYRAWVEQNRAYVHSQSEGKIGYVHIPDMGARGYAEFHRGYLAEVDRDGLIVDVRYNGGGHVSQLILEKLARRRIGYDWSRWGGIYPYPLESVAGPLVALTNEHAGSDGDIFCHSFKLMKLGPLVGKRTWGGVIGIHPRHSLVDGTITTQPEFSFWFEDVGWNVENYGTDPDIEVDISPQDARAGRDPQLDRAIAEATRLLAEHPIVKPDLSTRPSRAMPTLPPRS